MKPGIAVLLLATGASRRFGSDKRFAVLPNGRTLLEQSVATIEAANLPFHITARRGEPPPFDERQLVWLENAALGMGSSIAEAITLIGPRYEALMILPVDLPLLRSDTLQRLAEAAGPASLRRPVCGKRGGHPVVFGRDYFSELARLSGDEGARRVLFDNRDSLTSVVVNDPGIYTDVDTPQALKALARSEYF